MNSPSVSAGCWVKSAVGVSSDSGMTAQLRAGSARQLIDGGAA